MNKSPLAYVSRSQGAIKPHATDPSTEYENVDQEMTSWAPHDQYVYGADNKNLWHILHDSLKDHPSYNSIRYFARTQKSRAAYLALTLHNLGESRNHTILKEADENLKNVFHTEEKLNFTFNHFVEINRSAHNNMLSVPDYVVYNPATRVCKLLSNIRSNNPTLLASIASVQTSMTLRNDFEQTVDTLQLEIRAKKITTSRKQIISALTGGRGGRGGRTGGGRGGGGNHYQGKRLYTGGRGGSGAHGGRGSSDKCVQLNNHINPPKGIDWVEDKFYEPGFYAKCTAEEKTWLHELCNSRNATPHATPKSALVELQLIQLE